MSISRIIIFFCLMVPLKVLSQSLKTDSVTQKRYEHSIGIKAGINDFHFLDNYLSPYIFSKTMFTTGLTYRFQGKKYRHNIDFSFSTGHPESNEQSRSVTEQAGTFSYSVTRVAGRKEISGKPLELSLGAGLSSLITNTDFIAHDDASSYEWVEQSWYCSNSINLLSRLEYSPARKKKVFLELALPVFKIVSRPESGHFLSENNLKVINRFTDVFMQGKPEYAWENLSLAFKAGYSQSLGKRFIFHIDYVFEYVHSARPLAFRMYMNQLLAGIDFRL